MIDPFSRSGLIICDYVLSAWLEMLTLAFSCGARSAFKLKGKRLVEKHAIAPSAARLCYAVHSIDLMVLREMLVD